MALDGIFLRHVCNELCMLAIDSKVDKVYQPSKNEIVLSLRTHSGNKKLFISANSGVGRINFTEHKTENPEKPPMFCMLLRKRLTGAKLIAINQVELDRVLKLSFDTINTLGDRETLYLMVELIGLQNNIILLDDSNKIIEAIKRVGLSDSEKRIIMPGVEYKLPENQGKLSLLTATKEQALEAVLAQRGKSKNLAQAILHSLQGLCPMVCGELEFKAGDNEENLKAVLEKLCELVKNTSGKPYMLIDEQKPRDISFMPIFQYGSFVKCEEKESFCALLDEFFVSRDDANRMRAKTKELNKKLNGTSTRLRKKIGLQEEELRKSQDREKYKVCGDLLSANIYLLKKGMQSIELDNFYSGEKQLIRLDSLLTPSQNVQRYYKKYKKAVKAEEFLQKEIEKARAEQKYIDSVIYMLSKAETGEEIDCIADELYEQKYIKKSKHRQTHKNKFKPLTFYTSSGKQVLVGKNNKENDRLTLKFASKDDIWFHVKDIPGSHTVLLSGEGKVSDEDIYEAACIAAYHSKAKNSSKVAVDYSYIKNVKKPNGAKPGMVIYVKYKTVFAEPCKGNTA